MPAATTDLLSPDFYADVEGMHDALRRLRQEGPVWRDEANGLWAVLRHAPLIEVERQGDVFCNELGYRSLPMPPGLERDMIALDDPDHAAQRALVARRFTPRAVKERLEPEVSRVATELVDALVARAGDPGGSAGGAGGPGGAGEMEVVGDLAAPLPARLTAHLLGFPEERAPEVRDWSERLMRVDRTMADPEAQAGFVTAIMEFAQVVGPLLDERKACPFGSPGSPDDLLAVWAHAELGDQPMGPQEIVQETGLFISGGAETTRTVIARGLVAFADHPDQWEALAADPSLVPGAVEEMIRWVTPLNNFFRTATRPATIAGTAVAEGDRVVLLYPSANRDEAVFADPYTFDIRRNPNPQVAFGFGTHYCLGASLARMELRILLEQLTRRITALEVLEPPDIEPNIFVGAVRSCRVGYRAR